MRTTCFWNNLNQASQKIAKQNNLKVFGNKKTKGRK